MHSDVERKWLPRPPGLGIPRAGAAYSTHSRMGLIMSGGERASNKPLDSVVSTVDGSSITEHTDMPEALTGHCQVTRSPNVKSKLLEEFRFQALVDDSTLVVTGGWNVLGNRASENAYQLQLRQGQRILLSIEE